MYGFVAKKLLALVAIIMLSFFIGPVSASTPNDLGTTTVIIIEPVSGKKDMEGNITHRDGCCIEGTKGPPAIYSAENSQENNYYTPVSAREITEPNIDERSTLQNTGPPEVSPQPMRGILLVGIFCR